MTFEEWFVRKYPIEKIPEGSVRNDFKEASKKAWYAGNEEGYFRGIEVGQVAGYWSVV